MKKRIGSIAITAGSFTLLGWMDKLYAEGFEVTFSIAVRITERAAAQYYVAKFEPSAKKFMHGMMKRLPQLTRDLAH